MCGIFGIVYRDGKTVPEHGLLETSAQLLAHRGPDSAGVHSEPGVGFAHTRLSLLDLSERGKQPFWDPNHHYCIVYNGTVYNFKELRGDLERRGMTFRTTTDTEVILQSLIADGVEETVKKLEGMFAFAFYDSMKRSLVLARDRFGIKPLAVFVGEDIFMFASEIKAMKPWMKLNPNPFQLTSYLLGFGGPTKNKCFYKDVVLVPPGTVISLTIGEQPDFRKILRLTDMLGQRETESLRSLRPERLVDLVDEHLQRAVRQMLYADAPVGALCSGGVDSSVVTAMAARERNNLAIFHANVVGRSSEYDAALALSKHLSLDLMTVDVHDQDFVDMIPDVCAHYEHPFSYHPNSVPFLMVAKLVRQHGVKGVLSGEGSDECFLGYRRLVQEPFVRFYETNLQRLKRLLRRTPLFGRVSRDDDQSLKLVADMLNLFERDLEKESIRASYEATIGSPAGWNVRTLYMLSYHLRTLLDRNDRMGMGASIEARFPFLDERLVRTAINLPHNAKIRFGPGVFEKSHPFLRDKWVIRKVADRYVPRELSRRKKLGFPVDAFKRISIPASYFRNSFVADFFDLTAAELNHLLERADWMLKVRLLMIDVWGEICLGCTSPNEMRERLRTHVFVISE